MSRQILLLAGIFAAVIAGGDAFAAAAGQPGPEYILTVPVAVADLPGDIERVEVTCSLLAPMPGGALESLGNGTAGVNIGVRRIMSVTADIPVPVTRSPLAVGRVPTQYYCSLKLLGNVGRLPVEYLSYAAANGATGLATAPGISPRLEIPAAPNTPRQLIIQKPFPPLAR